MAKQQFQNVRGMPDVLPQDQPVLRHIYSNFNKIASQAGFLEIETPIVEDRLVFVRAVGEGTDVVDKEMYVFNDRSDNQVALRPEPTAGIVRSYIQNGMGSWPQPVKFQVSGPMFRYDRPQAGRQRQFHQIGVEMFGEVSPSADAQVILLANRLFKSIGLTQLSLQINSIGDGTCRPKYRKLLVDYLNAHKNQLCELDQARIEKNPLRVLDCKEPQCQAVIADAPQTLNNLCKNCQEHFSGVIEYLDALEISYELNPLLVRGLDYYTRTVFEFYGQREGAQSSLGGGGRYDGLVELLGGQSTPAVGFGLGVERMAIEIVAENIEPEPARAVDVFVASLGEPARLAAFKLLEQLLDAGVGAAGAVDKNGIASQLSRADRLGVKSTIIIGQKEVFDQTVIVRDMASGAQEMIPINKVVGELQRRFKS
ncbi:MAG: histidine--tRNA ligase [Candidatus Saccharimonadia bacterium]